jgi:hypothetical protein
MWLEQWNAVLPYLRKTSLLISIHFFTDNVNTNVHKISVKPTLYFFASICFGLYLVIFRKTCLNFHLFTVHVVTFTLLKINSCTYFKKHSFTFTLKTPKLVKKCSVKGVIIKPYMFRSLFHDHPRGSSFVLSASTTFQLPASSFVFFGFVAVCPLFVCVSGVPVCVLSGRELSVHNKTTHRQLHRTHIQIDGIRPQIPKRHIMKQAGDRWWVH